MKRLKQYIPSILVFGVLVFLDQLTKWLAYERLAGKEAYEIIPNVLSFDYLVNHGAAWGILQGRTFFLCVFPSVLLLLLIWMFLKIPAEPKYRKLRFLFVVLCAGATGNLWDRIFNQGGVIDFIYFEPIDFPKFNLADSYITVSIFIIAFFTLFKYKEEELTFFRFRNLFSIRRKDTGNQEESKTEDIE